jgi:hypothetical protein
MSAGLASVCVVLAATHLVLGWRLGFQSLSAYVISWSFFAIVTLPAWRVTRSLFPSSASCDLVIRTAVLSFADIVFAGLALGSVHLIGTLAYFGVFAAVFAVSRFFEVDHPPAGEPARLPIPIAAVVVPLLAFVVAVGFLRSPLTLYDSLSYHLVFPARWLQESALSIVQTPFSDPAQAYQPATASCFSCG